MTSVTAKRGNMTPETDSEEFCHYFTSSSFYLIMTMGRETHRTELAALVCAEVAKITVYSFSE